jgi:hypothetical protein
MWFASLEERSRQRPVVDSDQTIKPECEARRFDNGQTLRAMPDD